MLEENNIKRLDKESMSGINFIPRYVRIPSDMEYGSIVTHEHYNELLKIFHKGYFDEESTELIYKTMIFHLQMMDECFVEKVLFGNNVYDDDYEIGCRSIEERKRISSVIRQNKNAFMKLFSLFYFDLWD